MVEHQNDLKKKKKVKKISIHKYQRRNTFKHKRYGKKIIN